jgi:ribonuclease R
VQAIIAGTDLPAGAVPVEAPLKELVLAMHELSRTLTKKRMREGSIDFDTAEAKFRFDSAGRPVEVIKKVRLDSHRLVEEFMLLANRMVARHIGIAREKDLVKPFLYRVHDVPDPDRVRELGVFVSRFGFKLNVEGGVSSKNLQQLLESVRGSEVENVINEITLRSMAKAIYSERNIGHFGLAFDYYSHFTSPIRRYPDLVIHRMLKRYAGDMPAREMNDWRLRLPGIARQSSDMERLAMGAERAAVKVVQVEFMKQHLGEEFPAVVSGVARYGVFVELTDTLVEGMVHVRELDDDYYVYEEKHYALVGRHTGRQFRLGDQVRVKVIRVNPVERQIDFAMAPAEKPSPSGRPRRKS